MLILHVKKHKRFILASSNPIFNMRPVILIQLFLLFLLPGLPSLLRGQSTIDSLLAAYHQADPQEKMYVHFDKSVYNPGETIWFKAYLFTGLERSQTSKNFYAELRDENGILLDKKTAPILLSGAASHFELPATLTKPVVYFRAYTVAMLASDTDFIYSKAIKIVQAAKKPATKPGNVELAFLPEGGDLVAGLNSVVAFKATTANGMPAGVKGYIKSADGAKLTDFAAIHNGMGSFMLQPAKDVAYTAVWKDEFQKEHTTQLPAVQSTGLVIHIADAEDGNPSAGKRFTIQRPENSGDELKYLTVVSVINRQVAYEAKINMSAKTAISAVMPTQELPTGILQVTVLDKDQKPVAERICFVNNNNFEFDADAWISELNTNKRSLNRAEIKIADTITSNFSISITDADLNVPPPNDDNIVSHMLLSGDLRGKIYQPYYYFYSTSDSVPLHLDLLMLTHGWRRYNWKQLLSGQLPGGMPRESNYLGIQGKIITAQSGNLPEGLQLTGFLRTDDSVSNFIMLPIDRKGNVWKDGFVFYDSAKMYLNFNDKSRTFEASMFNVNNGLLQGNIQTGMKTSLAQIAYDPDTLVAAKNLKNNVNELKVAARQYKDAHELQNVTVTARAKTNLQKMDEKYANGLFSGGNSTSFDVANDPFAAGSFSVFQYLQGKVAGLQISGGGPTPTLTWRGSTPGLYLDEMQADAQLLSGINMANVAYIKVFTPGSNAAIANSAGGVISVYTKKGGDVTSTPGDSRLGLVRINGYSAIKQFYAADYSAPSPDDFYDNLRTTLFWDPFVILDKSKKRYKFQFYNNDISTRFRIVLEGINEDGKLIHIEKLAGK